MKRVDISNNLQHNSLLSPPKAPPPPETFKLSSGLNEGSESAESLLCYRTRWVVLANRGWSQPSSLQVACKRHWKHKVKAHVDPLRYGDCAVRDFVSFCTCSSRERKVGKGIKGAPEKPCFRLRVCLWEESCRKESWNHEQRRCLFFMCALIVLCSRKRRFYILCNKVGLY